MKRKHIMLVLAVLLLAAFTQEGCRSHHRSPQRSKKGCNCNF